MDTDPGYMELPATLPMVDEEGHDLVIELGSPMWGESGAGRDWACEFGAQLADMGWQRDDTVPCVWRFAEPGNDAVMVTIVDDFLISEAHGYSIADRTIELLRSNNGGVTCEREPKVFVGYKIDRNRRARAITLSMPRKIQEAVNKYMPGRKRGEAKRDIPARNESVKKMDAFADSLRDNLVPLEAGAKVSKTGMRVQQITGDLMFIHRIMPAISKPLHCLQQVMSNPPPGAELLADEVLLYCWAHMDDGITFGGGGLAGSKRVVTHTAATGMHRDQAPRDLEMWGDATWKTHNNMGVIGTYYGGAFYHATKRIAVLVSCSQESECVATVHAAQVALYAREVLRALGVPAAGASLVGSDNIASLLVAKSTGSAAKCKHFLRRYASLREYQARGDIDLHFVSDVDNPADFLTKWLGKQKLMQSVKYATNSDAHCGGSSEV